MLKRLLILTSFLFVGCDETPSKQNFDYQHRLKSQLSLTEINGYRDAKKVTLRQLNSPEQNQTISLLQLAQMQHCQLGQLIAEHNTQLGKMALPSVLFTYQIRFIQLAPKCIAQSTQTQTKNTLEAVLAEKKRSIFFYWQNMVQNDPQLRALYLAAPFSLQQVNEAQKQASHMSLHYLADISNALQSERYQDIEISQLEYNLSLLYGNTYIPSLLRAMQEQIYLTEQQSEQLEGISIEKLCKPNHNTQQAQILTTVFSKFYGKGIQQYHNFLLKEYRFILPYLKQLWTGTATQFIFKENAASVLSLDAQLKASSLRHVTWWQDFYKACKISPG